MKHSLWRLISSFYILLISGLMVIISAYAWMVISKSPGVSGVNTGISVPKAFYDKVTVPEETLNSLSLQNIMRKPLNDNTMEYFIDSAEDFVVVMRAIANGEVKGNAVLCLRTHISLEPTSVWRVTDEDEGLESVKIGALTSEIGNIRLYADINRLGMSTVYIKDLENALFSSDGNADIQTSLELENITLVEAMIESGEDGTAGAFLASTANIPFVSIRDCYLIDSKISGESVGGFVGNANAGRLLIRDCAVSGSEFTGSYVGEFIGTVEDGSEAVIIDSVTESNQLLQSSNPVSENALCGSINGIFNLVDTVNSTVEVYGGFSQVAADCFYQNTVKQHWKIHGMIIMKKELRFHGSHVDIEGVGGSDNAVIKLMDPSAGFNFGYGGTTTAIFQENSSVKFTGVRFTNAKTTSENSTDLSQQYMYTKARTVIYNNCTFEEGLAVFGNVKFGNCTFITSGSAELCLILDNAGYDCVINDCEFTAETPAKFCVVSKGTKTLTVSKVTFNNATDSPDIALNGKTTVHYKQNLPEESGEA